MPCELRFKHFNMAHQLHILQLVLHTTWPTELALPLCTAFPWGTRTALRKSHSSLRTSSISLVALAALWVSSSVGGALPWAPKVSSGEFYRGLINLKCQSWILFLPLALSALPCLPWHPQVPSPCQVHCLAIVGSQWILVERMQCCKFFLREFSSSLETLISLVAHEDLLPFIYIIHAYIWEERQGSVCTCSSRE